ncbi:unnamed protein product [Enterobius vermicularis]|uniref:Laminin IV type A domain-containing protein n=1 Tax=Enterobius vermicularis TaxID=51028 RepID=A0A0N4VFX4_ENTVE|nr:unnamed protein product [Enterobius vermicularis]
MCRVVASLRFKAVFGMWKTGNNVLLCDKRKSTAVRTKTRTMLGCGEWMGGDLGIWSIKFAYSLLPDFQSFMNIGVRLEMGAGLDIRGGGEWFVVVDDDQKNR